MNQLEILDVKLAVITKKKKNPIDGVNCKFNLKGNQSICQISKWKQMYKRTVKTHQG